MHGTMRAVLVAVVAMLALATAYQVGRGTSPEEPKPARLFEMRIYTCHPDKLEALHDRFRDHTNRLFEKHGMEMVGYWTPADDPKSEHTLVFILAYPSREAREAAWKAFRDDPEWQAAFEASHADGPIVAEAESFFLVPTDYSPIR